MAADGTILMRDGEKRPIFVQETVTSGTLTIQAGATLTLYNSAGGVVTGFNAVSVTGYDVGALANPRVWYLLDTTMAAVTPGTYTAVFTFTAVGADAITRVYTPSVQVTITALPDTVNTYDLSTGIGQTRLCLADTDLTNAIWDDPEITLALTRSGSIPELACAFLLLAASADTARQAKILQIGTDRWDRSQISAQLRDAAIAWQKNAPVAMAVTTTDAIFTIGSESAGTVGSMDLW